MVGGLLLTTASVQQTPSIQPDPVVAKLLPAAATSRRAFPQSDTIALYTEIYDNITSKQPRRIEVAVRLLSETGTEVFVSRDELTNGLASLGTTGAQGGKAWDTYGYAKGIPLKELPPGRYLLRVEAQVRGDDDVKPVARETLITVLN